MRSAPRYHTKIWQTPLFNHVDIVVTSRCRRGGLSSGCRSRSRLFCLFSCTRGSTTTPVILHLLVELLLCLLGTGVASTAGFSVLASLSPATTTAAAADWGPLAGDVTINVFGSRLGYIAAAVVCTSTTATTTASAILSAFTPVSSGA